MRAAAAAEDFRKWRREFDEFMARSVVVKDATTGWVVVACGWIEERRSASAIEKRDSGDSD